MVSPIATNTSGSRASAEIPPALSVERVVVANRAENPVSNTPGNTVSISPLARQLADSAARAQIRDNTLSRSQLADKAKTF